MKKFLLFVLSMLLTASVIFAQDKTVSGKITAAEDGSGLPGVNVVLKGTSSGAVTDVDGNFKMVVPGDGGVLVFSFIGFQTQEVTIGNQSVINISLNAEVTQLSEIVVTALGIERERQVPQGVARESGDDGQDLVDAQDQCVLRRGLDDDELARGPCGDTRSPGCISRHDAPPG